MQASTDVHRLLESKYVSPSALQGVGGRQNHKQITSDQNMMDLLFLHLTVKSERLYGWSNELHPH